jgi:hypothetical protein
MLRATGMPDGPAPIITSSFIGGCSISGWIHHYPTPIPWLEIIHILSLNCNNNSSKDTLGFQPTQASTIFDVGDQMEYDESIR